MRQWPNATLLKKRSEVQRTCPEGESHLEFAPLTPVAPLITQGIDLFAGAGGLSLGAKLAGIKITHAVENHHAAAATYRLNHPHTSVLEGDIRHVTSLERLKNHTLILFGGPPCQGFSTSNQRTRDVGNPKNWLFGEFFRIAKQLRPEWIVLENVRGLRETAAGYFEALIFAEFQKLGYAAELWTLCASDHGVPQKRHRLFFVGSRKGKLPLQPPRSTITPLSVREAISDLPALEIGASVDELAYRSGGASAYARGRRNGQRTSTGHLVTANNALVRLRYQHIPQGGNWTHIPSALMMNYTNLVSNRSRHSGVYRRLSWDEPSAVIANFRKNMLVHPDQDRGLSIREAARIQSFPDSYRFSGSIGLRQQQVSNAVPPLLAQAVFSQILNHS